MNAEAPSVVLASTSGIRRRTLAAAGVVFEALSPGVDEDAAKQALLADGVGPREIADALAELKAIRASMKRPGALVIGADTTLDLDGALIDKAADMAAAFIEEALALVPPELRPASLSTPASTGSAVPGHAQTGTIEAVRSALIQIPNNDLDYDSWVRIGLANDELSIGDFVLTNGALPAMVVIDAVTRLLPGVLGDDDSSREESFSHGLLEYPQYTRPAEFRGMKVPEVLLNGNHAEIAKWRQAQARQRTEKQRPDLLAVAVRRLLDEPDLAARLAANASALVSDRYHTIELRNALDSAYTSNPPTRVRPGGQPGNRAEGPAHLGL